MRMQKANQILQAIRKLGEKRIPLTRVYRNLFCEELFLAAYGRLYKNQGALTPGIDPTETIDGMSLKRIKEIIDELRLERFHFRPVRRSYVEKKSGGKRPLGITDFKEKLVQEVLRMILEAYYEPQIRDSSHGFRYQRGCHTALTTIKRKFGGTVWFIEGDIRGCFDNVDHDVLMAILARKIQDGRLLELIRRSLKTGVIEDWTYHQTYSGTPQGGVLSPILSNIYLHELDTFVEDVLIPRYTRGKQRKDNREYRNVQCRMLYARKQGQDEQAQKLQQQLQQMPSKDTKDPNFRRLKYIRYADDFILGFIGPKFEAEEIRNELGLFLQDALNLEMNESKTLITHARTQQAQFLGYAISVQHANDKVTSNRRTGAKPRSVNGGIRLGIPYGLIDQHIQRYMKDGKVRAEYGMIYHSDVHIINAFQQRFRGIANYYKYAVDRTKLRKLEHVMEESLVKTLARKFKISAKQIYRKYRGKLDVNGYTYTTLQVTTPTKNGTSLTYWGAIPLKVVKVGHETITDEIPFDRKYARTDLVQRLLADECELCGSHDSIEVHHVRKLSNLKQRWSGRKEKPEWVIRMIALHRKTLVVCRKCHVDIHAGRPTPSSRE